MLITLSGWSWSLILIGTGVMLFIFVISRVVNSCSTVPLALLVTTDSTMDALDIVDVFVGTPLLTSDNCFVSCVFRVEQSVPVYNVSVPTGTMSVVQSGALQGAQF